MRVKDRLFIHAGFPKSGSSTIQNALGINEDALAARGFHIFKYDFKIKKGLPGPLWSLESLKNKNCDIAQLVVDNVDLFKKDSNIDKADFILSAENLNDHKFPKLFSGIDDCFETSVIFYVRSQYEWLASAWKQFEIPSGKPLPVFIEQALKAGYPSYYSDIAEWSHYLKKSKIIVRPLLPSLLYEGSLQKDFFSLLGIDDELKVSLSINSSFDYSVLHMLLLNSDVFLDNQPDKIFALLMDMMPPEFHKTNISLLDKEAGYAIVKRFSQENTALLLEYVIPTIKSQGFEELIKFFIPPMPSVSYLQLRESAIKERYDYVLQKCLPDTRLSQFFSKPKMRR